MSNLSNKTGTIAHYLNKNMSRIGDCLSINKTKANLINLLNEGLKTGEITDKEEVNKVIPIIQTSTQNKLYSVITTLLTGEKVGNAKNGYGRIKEIN